MIVILLAAAMTIAMLIATAISLVNENARNRQVQTARSNFGRGYPIYRSGR